MSVKREYANEANMLVMLKKKKKRKNLEFYDTFY